MRVLSTFILSSLLFSASLAQPEKTATPGPSTLKADSTSGQAASGTQNIVTRTNSLGLTVPWACIAKGIDDRRNPVEPGTEFNADVKRLYCITQIKGVKSSATIEHRWYNNDVLVSTIELPVKSVMWRTQSYKTILPSMTGVWKVDVVLLPGEEILTTLHFAIR